MTLPPSPAPGAHDPALEVRRLRKDFGERSVLSDVSFTLAPGRITGFVGSNGAGKTTTMRIIMGLLRPDSGEVRWQGRPIGGDARRHFGYMPEERGLYPKQGIHEQLVYFARLHGVPAAEAGRKATGLLDRFGLAGRAGERLERLSLGNQQRVQIAVALIHDPIALVLDEPFSGLDPDAVDDMTGLLRERVAQGVPVLFSSHQLDLVERICDDVVIIAAGRIVAAGSVPELRAFHGRLMRIDSPGIEDWIACAEGIVVRSTGAGTATFTPSRPDAASALLRQAVARGEVTHFADVAVPLAEIFREVVH